MASRLIGVWVVVAVVSAYVLVLTRGLDAF